MTEEQDPTLLPPMSPPSRKAPTFKRMEGGEPSRSKAALARIAAADAASKSEILEAELAQARKNAADAKAKYLDLLAAEATTEEERTAVLKKKKKK